MHAFITLVRHPGQGHLKSKRHREDWVSFIGEESSSWLVFKDGAAYYNKKGRTIGTQFCDAWKAFNEPAPAEGDPAAADENYAAAGGGLRSRVLYIHCSKRTC